MKNNILYVLWAILFTLCAALGFLPDPTGAAAVLLTVLSVAHFVPPAVLLYRASKADDRHTLSLIRNLSALSLLLTLLFLILNFLSALSSELVGTILYYILIIVSSPMIASGYWFTSLFLWACLLMTALRELRRLGK